MVFVIISTVFAMFSFAYAKETINICSKCSKELVMYNGSKELHEKSKEKIDSFLGNKGEVNSRLQLNFDINEDGDKNSAIITGHGVLKNGTIVFHFTGNGELKVDYVDGNPVYVGPMSAKVNGIGTPINLGIHYYPNKNKLFVSVVINEIGDDTIRMHFGEPFVEANSIVQALLETTMQAEAENQQMQGIVPLAAGDYVIESTYNNTYIKTVAGHSDATSVNDGTSYTSVADVYSKNSAVRTWWENNYDYPGATEVINTVGENYVDIEIDYSETWDCNDSDAEPASSSYHVNVPYITLSGGIDTFSISLDNVTRTVSDSSERASWHFNSPIIGTNPAGGKFRPICRAHGQFTVEVDTAINYAVYIDLYNDEWNPYSILEYHYASNPTISWSVN